MIDIVNVVARSAIISRLDKEEAKEVAAVIMKINEKLNASKELPVKFMRAEFGSTNKIRAEVDRRVKLAGWGVQPTSFKFGSKDPLPDSECYYEVQ